MIEQYKCYRGTVRLRRDIGLEVKPEAECLDGKVVTVFAAGLINDEEDPAYSRYPNEWLMVFEPPEQGDEADISGLASGDLVDLEEIGWLSEFRRALKAQKGIR